MAALNPRIEEFGPVTIVGLIRPHVPATMRSSIPAQWKLFESEVAFISGRRDPNTYGVFYRVLQGGAQSFSYLTGVPVGDFAPQPQHLSSSLLAKQSYAKFPHDGDVSTLRNTIDAAMNNWLPQSRMVHAASLPNSDAPDFIERYGPGFNPATGTGDIEVWIPVRPA